MPCPRVPKPHDGQRLAATGRTVLMQGTERVQTSGQDTRQAAQDASEPAPAPQPVSGCQEWQDDELGDLTHRGCGGPVRTSRGLPRMHCPKCGAEWVRQGGEWKRI